jgi:hypothetical protein
MKTGMIPSERAIEKSDLPDLVQELERKAATLEGWKTALTKGNLSELLVCLIPSPAYAGSNPFHSIILTVVTGYAS